MMGGEIWVESEPGKGKRVSIHGKIRLGEEGDQKASGASVDLRGMRVLVVDDNASSESSADPARKHEF